MIACLALGAFSVAGCSDDDGGGDNPGFDAADTNGGDGSTSNTSLGQAIEAACDKKVECTFEGGPSEGGPSREVLCASYSLAETTANALGGACVSTAETYLNCFASTACEEIASSCQSELEAYQNSCSVVGN